MNNTIEYFINQLNLENMTTHGNKINFRCNICGDSKESVSKKRGWLMLSDDGEYATFHCFNCGATLPFDKYLERINEFDILEEYLNNKNQAYIKSRTLVKTKSIKNVENSKIIYKKLSKKSFSSVLKHSDHLRYLKNRQVPADIIKKCYVYTGDKWYNNYLVLPFLNGDKLYGFQARSIKEKSFYISKLNDITIWNYFNVDIDNVVYILEGMFDAFHVRNSIAVLGASKGEDFVKKIPRRVYVYDCDERGYIDSLKRAKEGERVCLLWKYIAEYKDINNYICSTGDDDIMTKILNSIYSGVDAEMELYQIKRKYGYSDNIENETIGSDKLRKDIDYIINRGV